MTPEEKALLLQDLSARLPYGVKFAITSQLPLPKGRGLSKGVNPLAWHVDKCSY